MASSTWLGSSEPDVHALPEEAQMPASSSRRRRLSPSMPSKQKFTLPGRRFVSSPLSAACGMVLSPAMSLSRRALTYAAFFIEIRARLGKRRSHGDDAADIFRTGTLASLLRAALDHVHQRDAPAGIQCADCPSGRGTCARKWRAYRCSPLLRRWRHGPPPAPRRCGR